MAGSRRYSEQVTIFSAGRPTTMNSGSVVLVLVASFWLVSAQNATVTPTTFSRTPRNSPTVSPLFNTDENATTTTFIPTVSPLGSESNLKPDCFTNLTELHEFTERKDPFIVEKFILCPNTVFELGTYGINGECCVGGMAPLDPPSNTHILCGEDGKSSNNCTLRGGQIQLITGGSSLQKVEVINVLIQGITFVAGLGASVVLVSAGDVTFVDCIFKDHRNVGVVSLLFVLETRLLWTENQTEHKPVSLLYEKFKHKPNKFIDALGARDKSVSDSRSNRHLQDVPTTITRQNVAFRYCTFRNNSYSDQTIESGTNGVISSESPDNDLSFDGCIFEDNLFGDSLVSSDGFAIRLFRGNIVNLTNNCFINNKFVGNGTVIAPVQNDIITSGNSGSNNGQLVCEFIYVENQNNCWNFESESCLNGSPPSASPPSPSSSFRRKISFPLVVATSALLSLFLFAAVS